MRRLRLAAQSVVVVAAAAVAAAGTRMRSQVTFARRELNADLWGSVALALLVVGVILTVWLQLRHRDNRRRRREPTAARLIARILFVAVLAAAAVLYRWAYAGGFTPFGGDGSSGPADPGHSGPTDGGSSIASGDFWPLVGIVLVVGMLVTVYLLRRRRPLAVSEAERIESASLVADVARAGLSALRIDDDARTSVIRCYESMAAEIQRRGVRSTAADTPTDLLARATRNGVLNDADGGELLELFQVARYSSEPLPADATDRAAVALGRIIADAGRSRQPADA